MLARVKKRRLEKLEDAGERNFILGLGLLEVHHADNFGSTLHHFLREHGHSSSCFKHPQLSRQSRRPKTSAVSRPIPRRAASCIALAFYGQKHDGTFSAVCAMRGIVHSVDRMLSTFFSLWKERSCGSIQIWISDLVMLEASANAIFFRLQEAETNKMTQLQDSFGEIY